MPVTSQMPDVAASRPEQDEDVLPALPSSGGAPAFWQRARVPIEALLANRTRTVVTMLGVIIGVASVVALLAIGNGATAAITGQVQALGTNLLAIVPEAPSSRGPNSASTGLELTLADADAIAALHLPLAGVSPQFQGSADVVAPAADKTA